MKKAADISGRHKKRAAVNAERAFHLTKTHETDMLNIYFGRESLDKEKFIFDRISGNGRTLIICPDQFTLELEEDLFRYSGRRSLMDIEVISPSRLGERILSELGGSRRRLIDKYGRHMLLSGIIAGMSGELKAFSGFEKNPSFAALVNDFIFELKSSDIKPSDLDRMIGKLDPDSLTAKKLSDLKLFYERYEEKIAGRYTDSEDYQDLWIGKVKDSKLIAGNTVWLYGFDSIPPKTVALIGELIQNAEEVNAVITASFDEEERDCDLFELGRTVAYNLRTAAEARAVSVNTEEIPEEYAFSEKPAELKHIEKELYAIPSVPLSGEGTGENVRLVKAANLYDEAEAAAEYVLGLVRDEGYRYREIRIICNDTETRGPIIKRVFGEYGMHVFSDESRDITGHPAVRYITSLIDVLIEKYRTESLIRHIKAGFCDLTYEEISDLENYAIKYRIRGGMWTSKFKKGAFEYGEEGLERLDSLRKRAIADTEKARALFGSETNGEFVKGIYDFLYSEARLPEKLENVIEEQETGGREDLAEETRQVWAGTVRILDQINEITGDEKFDAETFRELMNAGFGALRIGMLPPTADGLIMGTMQRTRIGSVKALVVIGANEGILPSEAPSGGLFANDERELFKEEGVEFGRLDSVMNAEEKLGIYRNLSRASERIYMSAALSDTSGEKTPVSKVFARIAEILPEVKITERFALKAAEKGAAQGTAGLIRLTESLREVMDGGEISDDMLARLSWYGKNRPEDIENLRRGIAFKNIQPKLKKQLKELYKAREDSRYAEDELVMSPSRVESFARCPFAYFVEYGLKPEERRRFEIAGRETGDIYHECLMRMAMALTKDGVELTAPESGWMTVSRSDCDRMAGEIIDAISKDYRDGLLTAGKEEEYRSGRIRKNAAEVCWQMIEHVRAGEIAGADFEVSFGRGRKLKPVEVELSNGGKVIIEGKIDRADTLRSGRVKIIDYKTGQEKFNMDETRFGYRLQLMIYLEAACEGKREPAGVFYFKIHEAAAKLPQETAGEAKTEYEPALEAAAAKSSERIADAVEEIVRNSFTMSGIMIDDSEVLRSVAGEFEKESSVVAVKRKSDGSLSGTGGTSIVSEKAFGIFREEVQKKLTEICEGFADGDISVRPMKIEGRMTACDYCRASGVCRFSTAFEGCSYNEMPRKKKTAESEE